MHSLLQMWLAKFFFLFLLKNKKDNRKKYKLATEVDNFMNIFSIGFSQLILQNA